MSEQATAPGAGAATTRSIAPHDRRFWWLVAGVTAFGSALRFPGISAQVLLDDEWHALGRAARQPLSRLATHYFPRATSIPNNVYLRALLDTFGWTELGIRLPTLLSTLATFVVLPRVVARVFGSRALAVATTFVFAISQFWILYGQTSRPYATFLLLLILAYDRLLCALVTGRARDWMWFALFGASGVLFHLYALPVLAAFGLVAFAQTFAGAWRERAPAREIVKRLHLVVLGFALCAAMVGVFFAAPLANNMTRSFPRSLATGRWNADSWRHLGELLTSCRYPALVVVWLVAAAIGLASLVRRHRASVLPLAAGVLFTVMFTLTVRPKDYFAAIVFLRYNVVAHLLFFLGMGRAMELLATHVGALVARRWSQRSGRGAEAAAYAVSGLALLFASPIPRDLATRPNNFRLHSYYHEYYADGGRNVPYVADTDWKGPRNPAAEIPPFYRRLARAKHPCRVIELPLEIGDAHDHLYFYQQLHRCEVIAGYLPGDDIADALDAKANARHLKFRALVNVLELEGAPADFLIYHVDPHGEEKRLFGSARARRKQAPLADENVPMLAKKFGAPYYTDYDVAVFSLAGRSAATEPADSDTAATPAETPHNHRRHPRRKHAR